MDLLARGPHGVGADHARSATMQAGSRALAQPRLRHTRHVGGIAGHQEGGDRPVGIIEHDASTTCFKCPR